MAALVGVLLAVAAVALGVGHYLATPGALQHLCTASTQVFPEAGKLQHNAACRYWDRQAVLCLSLVGLHVQGPTLHDQQL